jgi:hypothetical protein
MFFLLFSLFHIYFFANPYGFAYTAMGVVGLFVLHSMAFFWHRYELPAVANGRVTIDRPRQHYDERRARTGGSGGGSSSSPGTPLSSPERNGLQTMQRQDAAFLQPQSPPQIRPSPESTIDFDPVTPDPSTLTTSRQQWGRDESVSLREGNTLGPRHHQPQQQPLASATQVPSSSSRNSSANSNHNAVREDDEDSSSYLYFMQGEVVLRRGNGTSSSTPAVLFNVESSHTLASSTSGEDVQQPAAASSPALAGLVTPTPLLRQSSVSSNHNVGLDLLDPPDGVMSCPGAIIYSSPSTTNMPPSTAAPPTLQMREQHQSLYETSSYAYDLGDDDSKSGLQSILEIRLTPRHRNSEEVRGNPSSPLPIFPSLPS